jgi:predicted enzyme related to lactoylglutathione lyase
MIKGLKLATVPVKDQDRALVFYVEKLGFRIATDQPMGGGQRWIELTIAGADTALALFTPPGFEDRVGTFTGLTFWSDDVEAEHDQLVARGVHIVKPPEKQPWGTYLIFADLDGNQFVVSGKR